MYMLMILIYAIFTLLFIIKSNTVIVNNIAYIYIMYSRI